VKGPRPLHALGPLRSRRESLDPTVTSLDELDTAASELLIRVEVLRNRGTLEVIERHEEPHGGIIVRDEVLQQEELYRSSVSPNRLASSRPR
jgi:hypothetical protein